MAHPPTHTLDRWERAAAAAAAGGSTSLPTENCVTGATAAGKEAVVEPGADAESAAARRAKLLGGRVYRLTKLVEKPTAEFARENLATPGLGTTAEGGGGGGAGRHLVVFGQYILPARRTFDILAEDIKLDRRERCVCGGLSLWCSERSVVAF